MLTGLSIRDFVLIEQLELSPGAGLTVLTGETGAGKSILLDALGAACGARSEAAWVRSGAEKASITASFSLKVKHPALALLRENDIEAEGGEVILRRTIGADGRSKAFTNDQPVSINLLRQIGDLLIEVHGQFDTHGLLDPATHRPALDRFAALDLEPLAQAYQNWKSAERVEVEAREGLAKAQAEEEFLRQTVDDLTKLAPKAGEEAELAAQKQLLQHREKVAEALGLAQQSLSGERGAEALLSGATRALSRIADKAPESVAKLIAHLDSARDAVAEAETLLEKMQDDAEGNGLSLEQVEDRLYALRTAARRHMVSVDDLPALTEKFSQQLNQLTLGEDHLHKLAEATLAARNLYERQAEDISAQRQRSAKKLDKAIKAELSPLKLERAEFTTSFARCAPSPLGVDEVIFTVSTNPGSPAGPLNKIASGGELARFMLALKVVLAGSSDAVALVFDEVDQGVGGAVAAAVGERLSRLARATPTLVVTHSPQVAAAGRTHWRVEKAVSGKTTRTHVAVLDDDARREEIARMLSGEVITDASRLAAIALLQGRAA